MAGTLATLRVNLVLNAGAFLTQLKLVQAQAITTGTVLNTALGVGAVAMVVGLVKATDAAMEWQDAMAGVRRTVNLEGEQLQHASEIYGQIEQDLRDLTKVMPITHDEIAAMAEQAGALGVPAQDIKEFVRSAGTLAELSDDLTPDITARAFGKIRTVMGMTTEDYYKAAGSIVQLGISGASTEAEILSMAERASGAFGQIGASVPELMAWSAAMANVGEKSEAGGTTLQRLGLIIQKHIANQSPKLEGIAQAAGMTSEAFTSMFETDASGAMAAYLNGLSELTPQMRALNLYAAGFSDIRLSRGLFKMIEAISQGLEGNLNDALADSEVGWNNQQALTDMAAERWSTAEQKLEILRNKFHDFAITIGNALLPFLSTFIDVLGFIATGLGNVAQAFPLVTNAVVQLMAVLSTVLAMRFGAKLLLMLLPGRIGPAIATAWGSFVATYITGPLMSALSGLGGLLKTAIVGAFGMMRGAVVAAAALLGSLSSAAFLGAWAAVLVILALELKQLGDLWGGIQESVQTIDKGKAEQTDWLATLPPVSEVKARIAEYKKTSEDMWEGATPGLKFFADAATQFGVRQTVALEDQIVAMEDYVKAVESGSLTPRAANNPFSGDWWEHQSITIEEGSAKTETALQQAVKRGHRALGNLYQLPKDFEGGVNKLRMTVSQGRLDVVSSMRDFWTGLRDSLENGPKIISRAQRIGNMDKLIKRLEARLRQAFKAHDPIATEWYANQLIQAKTQRKQFVNSQSLTAADTVKLYRELGLKVPKWMRKMAGGMTAQANRGADNVETAADRVKDSLDMDLYQGGVNTMNTWIAGMRSRISAAEQAAKDAAAAVAGPTVGTSPPKVGPLHHIDRGGYNVMAAWVDGLRSGMPLVRAGAYDVAGAFQPRVAVGNRRWGVGMSGGKHTHYHVGMYVGSDRGLDELDKRLTRRQRLRGRGAGRYNDPG